MFINGVDNILYIEIDGEYYPIGCLTSNSFSENTDVLESTTRDNNGWKTNRLTNQSYTISLSGLMLKEAISFTNFTYYDLTTIKRNRTLVNWRINKDYYGTGYITSLSNENSIDSFVSFSGELLGDGTPVIQIDFIFDAYKTRVLAGAGSIDNEKCLKKYIDELLKEDDYDNASIIVPQSAGVSAGDVYALKPTNGDADLTFTRNIACDRIDANGDSVEVSANVPRLDYKKEYVHATDNSYYSFDGVDDYAEVIASEKYGGVIQTHILNLEHGLEDVSSSGIHAIIDKGSNGGPNSTDWVFWKSSGQYLFYYSNGLSNSIIIVNYTDGVKHIAFVIDRTDFEYYENGVLVQSEIMDYAVQVVTKPIYYATFNKSSGFSKYSLKYSRQYNIRLSEQDLLDDYNGLPIPEKYKGANNVSIGAGDLTIGETYVIASLGDTNFTLAGASSNTVGEVFECTAIAPGSGTVFKAGNTLNLSTGKTESTWYDLEHDTQGTVNGAVLNNSIDFGNNVHSVNSCPSLLLEPEFTNLFLNPKTPVTQTITTVIGTTYTVNCKGTGVITISESGGSELGGAATEVDAFTYTATHTSVDITLETGEDFDWVQMSDTGYPCNLVNSNSTKPADKANKTGLSSYIGQTDGVFFIDLGNVRNNSVTDATKWFVEIRRDANNSFGLSSGGDDENPLVRFSTVIGGVATTEYQSTTMMSNSKIAIQYDASAFKIYQNGSLLYTVNKSIGDYSEIEFMEGALGDLRMEINSFEFYDTSLTESEIITLTT